MDRLTSVPQSLTVLQSAHETKDQDDDEYDAEDDTENEEHGAATARRQVNVSSSSYRQHSVIVRVGMLSRCDEQWRVCVVRRSRRVDRRCAVNNTFSAAAVFCCVACIYNIIFRINLHNWVLINFVSVNNSLGGGNDYHMARGVRSKAAAREYTGL